jgi:hypothetical protein
MVSPNTNNTNPWVLNAQSPNSGKKYGLGRHLPDSVVNNLSLTPEEMAIVQAELTKTTPVPSKVDVALESVRQYSPPKQPVGDTFQATASPRSGVLSPVAYPVQPAGDALTTTPAQPSTPQQMTPEQAQMLQQMLAGGGGATAVQGAGGIQGGLQNVGSTALTVLEKANEGLASGMKGMIFGNPDITLLQGAGTLGAGFVIANAGGLALNKLNGYDWAGGMPLNAGAEKAVHDSWVGQFARLLDKVQIGFKGHDGKSFSYGYLDNAPLPDTVRRLLGNNRGLQDGVRTIPGGGEKAVYGDVKQYFHSFFDQMLGKTVQNADGTFSFETRGMVAENASIVPPKLRGQFEAILTAERLHHIKNMTYNVDDNEVMGHLTHKMLEQVSNNGWGEGFFSAENLDPSTGRRTLVEKLLAAHTDLVNQKKIAPLPDGISIDDLLQETNGKQVSEHLQHLFKAEVVEHAFEQDKDKSLRALLEQPLKVLQERIPVFTSEAQIELVKKKIYGLYGKDFMAQTPQGIAHKAIGMLDDLEKGILPSNGPLEWLTNGFKKLMANISFSNEARSLFWKGGPDGQDGWNAPGGKREMLLKQIEQHADAFKQLYGDEIYAKNLTALKESKSFYQFQEIIRGMKTEGKFQLNLGWKAGELYDNILGRAKQMCAEDTGPRVMTAKAIEYMEVSGLGRIVPVFTHWFQKMWVGNPFEHPSTMMETAHFSNQQGKGLESLGKAIFGSGSLQSRFGRFAFMAGAMLAFTQSIGASFKERNPKFTTMPPADGKPSAGMPATPPITPLTQLPTAIGTNIASAASTNGLIPSGNGVMMANNTPMQPVNGSIWANNNPVGYGGMVAPRTVTPTTVAPAPTPATLATPTPAQGTQTAPAAYQANVGDMGRAFSREFVSAGLGFMVFTGLFNAINTQTQWLCKAMGRFAPQTFKWPIPVLGPLRMNWLGAAINLGGAFLLMPKITEGLLAISDKILGKPQYIKVEEAVKKQEEAKHKAEAEAKHKAEAEAKKQQQAQAKVGGLPPLPAGFNPAMIANTANSTT